MDAEYSKTRFINFSLFLAQKLSVNSYKLETQWPVHENTTNIYKAKAEVRCRKVHNMQERTSFCWNYIN